MEDPSMRSSCLGVVTLGLGLLLLAGCDRGGKMREMNDLKAIGIMYHEHAAVATKAPESAADLKPYAGTSPEAYQALVDGRVVFIYGVRHVDMSAGTANTVLGYLKDTPTAGGYALFGDGSVRKLSAEEFKQQPKAQPPKRAGGSSSEPAPTTSDEKKASRGGGIFGVRDETQNRLILRDIGLACKIEDVSKLPNTVDELKAIVKESAKAVRALDNGEFVLVPKARVASDSLFLYERDADTRGNRLVLMGDGSVHKKSAAEFAALQRGDTR
jgi:hypothetical protein